MYIITNSAQNIYIYLMPLVMIALPREAPSCIIHYAILNDCYYTATIIAARAHYVEHAYPRREKCVIPYIHMINEEIIQCEFCNQCIGYRYGRPLAKSKHVGGMSGLGGCEDDDDRVLDMSIWTRKLALSGRGAAIEGLCTAPVMHQMTSITLIKISTSASLVPGPSRVGQTGRRPTPQPRGQPMPMRRCVQQPRP